MKKIISLLLFTLLLIPTVASAQRKDGHWVNPVEYFKLKGKGNLKGDALYSYMWETKERYIVGMKCTISNFTTVGDDPVDSKLPVTKTSFYLYINENGVIAATSDWTSLPNGNMLGVYKIGATDVRFSFDEKSHHYSFFYYPEGSYDFAGHKGLAAEHSEALDIREMAMFYSETKGLIGYFENAYMINDDWEEDANGNVIDIAHKNEYYLQFTIDEVLLDGTDTPLTESERQSLIDTMDDLTDWLLGKGDPLGLGEHTDATESAVVEVIGLIGAVLLGNGVAAATGGGVGGALGAVTAPTGGSPSPMSSDMPKVETPELKKKEEEETPPEGDKPEEPKTPYFDKFMKQNPDGTLTTQDPATGKELTYYPTPDGKWESELGTVYDKESLNENMRFRHENADVLKQDAETAAKNVAEQHAQWEKDSKELSQNAKEYAAWKQEKAAEWEKEDKIIKLADKYGVPPTEKSVKDAIKFEQTMAQLDANQANTEAEEWGKGIERLETIDKTSEVIVNVMGETVPGGRVVKNVYTFAKSTAAAASEAYNQDMSLGDAAKHVGMGAASGVVGILQNQAGELTKNPFVEGVTVVGGESIRAGLDAIAHGKDVNDAMLQAAGKKAAFFITGKSVQFGMGQTGYQPPEMGQNTTNAMEKFLGKGDMHANWGNLASTNAVHVTEGIASAAQEAPFTFGGFDKAGESVQNLAYGVSSQTKHDVSDFVKTVKNFSNAAENFRKKQ